MRVWMAGFLFGIQSAQLLTALQAPEPAAAQERAAVSGTVIHAITGEPVRRAEVILTFLPGEANPGRTAGVSLTTRAGAAAQAPGGIRQQSRSAVTGPDGSFRFENVEEGEYGIFIRREGMFPGRHGPGLSPQRIRVRAGVPVSGLRYALAPQAVISGRVLDEEGEPAQGVQVVAFRRTLAQGGKAGLMSAGSGAQTDDRGYFRLVNLPAGKYLPCVRFTQARTALPDGAGRSIYVPLCYPNALTPEQGAWISVAAGQEVANIDFRLRRAAARRVSGRVLREDGTPARNVMIHLVHRDRAELPWFFTQTQDGSTPGSFLLEGVPAGSYDLVAREVDSSRPEKQPVATMHLEVGDEDVKGIELRFQPPFSIRGQVRLEGAGDSGRVPFGSLRIIAMPVGGGMGFANASAG